jgi:hypothetical protein
MTLSPAAFGAYNRIKPFTGTPADLPTFQMGINQMANLLTPTQGTSPEDFAQLQEGARFIALRLLTQIPSAPSSLSLALSQARTSLDFMQAIEEHLSTANSSQQPALSSRLHNALNLRQPQGMPAVQFAGLYLEKFRNLPISPSLEGFLLRLHSPYDNIAVRELTTFKLESLTSKTDPIQLIGEIAGFLEIRFSALQTPTSRTWGPAMGTSPRPTPQQGPTFYCDFHPPRLGFTLRHNTAECSRNPSSPNYNLPPPPKFHGPQPFRSRGPAPTSNPNHSPLGPSTSGN